MSPADRPTALEVSARTLEQLEWPQLVERVRAHARTPGGRRRFDPAPDAGLLAGDAATARTLLAETSEARVLLTAGATPPLGGVAEVAATLRRAERGGAVPAAELLDLGATLDAIDATARFGRREAERAPRLTAHAEALGHHRALARAIEATLDAEG